MAGIIEGVLQWFSKEYSFDEFSGGDLLSLAVLVLLAFALWIRRPQPNVFQAILSLKGEVKNIDGQLSALVAGPNIIRAKDILELKGEMSQIKGAVNTLVTVLVPQGDVRSPLPKKGNMPPPKDDK